MARTTTRLSSSRRASTPASAPTASSSRSTATSAMASSDGAADRAEMMVWSLRSSSSSTTAMSPPPLLPPASRPFVPGAQRLKRYARRLRQRPRPGPRRRAGGRPPAGARRSAGPARDPVLRRTSTRSPSRSMAVTAVNTRWARSSAQPVEEGGQGLAAPGEDDAVAGDLDRAQRADQAAFRLEGGGVGPALLQGGHQVAALPAAGGEAVRAAGVEAAAGGRVDGVGHLARGQAPVRVALGGVGGRDRLEQGPGVGVLGRGVDRPPRARSRPPGPGRGWRCGRRRTWPWPGRG